MSEPEGLELAKQLQWLLSKCLCGRCSSGSDEKPITVPSAGLPWSSQAELAWLQLPLGLSGLSFPICEMEMPFLPRGTMDTRQVSF